jgi:hypothetical protein
LRPKAYEYASQTLAVFNKQKSKREHKNKALEYWGKAPKVKVEEWQKYLVQFAEDYHETEEEGISKVTDTIVANPVAGGTIVQPTTSSVTKQKQLLLRRVLEIRSLLLE